MDLPKKLFNMPIHIGRKRKLEGYPLLYSNAYEFYNATISAVPCIIVLSKDSLRPLQVSKMFTDIQGKEGRWCVLASKKLTAYQRAKLSEYNVAWIVSDDTFHIPFLAAASCGRRGGEEPAALSANACLIAAHIIDGDWAGMTASEIAKLLGKSLSSVSNYMAEISAIDDALIGSKGRTRFIAVPENAQARRDAFDVLRPYLKSPVRKRRYLVLDQDGCKAIGALPHAGITALSERTMLADDPWMTCAVCFREKDVLKRIEVHSEQVTRNDEPDALLEIWDYDPCGKEGKIDSVSLFLSLEELVQDGSDERLEDALEQLKEGVFA